MSQVARMMRNVDGWLMDDSRRVVVDDATTKSRWPEWTDKLLSQRRKVVRMEARRVNNYLAAMFTTEIWR